MTTRLLILIITTLVSLSAKAAIIAVPGTADPWLAGMPDGSTNSSGDTAPAQSPVLVSGLSLLAGSFLQFTVTGGVAYSPIHPIAPPDGSSIGPHADGAQNGLASLLAPHESLVGVFLDSTRPDLSAPPASLDFTSLASREYLTLYPLLKQPFFIGDGLTSEGHRQGIAVPINATRLFLSAMDGFGWNNNIGSFNVGVEVAQVPEPTSTMLVLLGIGMLFRNKPA